MITGFWNYLSNLQSGDEDESMLFGQSPHGEGAVLE